jgi:cobalt-zinc-cadmium efflux system outer membrane protein
MPTETRSRRATKTPTVHRSSRGPSRRRASQCAGWVALPATALLFAITADAAHADAFTEAEIIRIARTRDPDVLAAREAIAAAQVEETRTGLYPNPTIGWEREHIPSDERTDSVVLSVPIDVLGRRPAERALARAGTAESRAEGARARSNAVTRSLDAFYEALASERETVLFAHTVARLEEAARVIERRHEAGTTSGYERARLDIEVELARSEWRLADARSRAARSALAALLGVDPAHLALRGDFATLDPGQTRPRSARPSFGYLRAAEAEADEARGDADWAWFPALFLSGGLHVRDAGAATDARHGYAAGVSLALPFFSRGQDVGAAAAARGRLLAEQLRAAEREAHVNEARARGLLAAARDEIARFTAATRERVELMERAAASGYREGDRSVIELLDAQRARTAVARRQLELEWFAKRSEVALRAARGEFE